MRTFITVFALGVLVLSLVLCPGCKKREITTLEGPVEVIGPGEELELVLPEEAPPIAAFGEAENQEVFQDIHFDFDRSEVRPVDRPILEGIAEYLKATPDMYLLVEGHCDERGTNEYNLGLGERRALSTRAFLAGLGVGAERMRTISRGEEDPKDPGHDEAAWARNRRAHFKVAVQGAAPA